MSRIFTFTLIILDVFKLFFLRKRFCLDICSFRVCYSSFVFLTYYFCLCLQPQNLCDIEQVTRIEVSKEDEVSHKIDIHLKDPDKEVCTYNTRLV